MESESEKRGELSPLRLPEKLRRIRLDNGLTQGKMLLIINPTESDEGNRARVSQYENNSRVPSLIEIYNYARFAGITVETLLNDNLDLPAATRQTKSDTNDDIPPMGNKARNSEIENDNSLFNVEDIARIENTFEPDENSSSEGQTLKPIQIQVDTSCINCSSSSGAIYSIRLSEEISNDGKSVFINLLGELPFNKMGQITPEKFLEQSIAAGLDDYHARRTKSALMRRMQLLFEEEAID